MTRLTTSLAAAALGLAVLTNSAAAGPASGAAAGAALKAAAAPLAEQVTYRCWRHRGHIHCGNVVPRVYSYYYAPRRYVASPYYFSYGYRRWY